jgi:hypothetical protein
MELGREIKRRRENPSRKEGFLLGESPNSGPEILLCAKRDTGDIK